MYFWDDQSSYVESVDYKGDRGAYLAPDECRTHYREKNELVRNCTEHAY